MGRPPQLASHFKDLEPLSKERRIQDIRDGCTPGASRGIVRQDEKAEELTTKLSNTVILWTFSLFVSFYSETSHACISGLPCFKLLIVFLINFVGHQSE